MNEEWCLLSGGSQDELVGRLYDQALAPTGSEFVDFVRAALSEEAVSTQHISHRHRHGFEIELEARSLPVVMPDGENGCLLGLRPRGWTGG